MKLPRLGQSPFVSQWLLATLVASLFMAFDGGWLASKLALIPSRIWLGEIWRLVTWPLIEASPQSLIITCIVIYVFGSELAVRWGDRRLERFMAHVVIAAAIVTVLLATITGHSRMMRLGGWAATDALVIAWARQFPERSVSIYGLLHLRGRDLIRFTFGTTIVFAIFFGPIYMAPELVACAVAATYPEAWLRRR